MDTIDSHALVVSHDRALYPFAGEAAPANPGELEACMDVPTLWSGLKDRAIAGGVLVQRNRFYGYDNRLVCDLARCSPALRALVSVDSRRDDCPALATRLIEQDGAFGLRFMEPQKGSDLGWIASEHARAAWHVAADLDAVIDVHAFPWNRQDVLTVLGDLMTRFPNVPVLLDNLGNGPIAADVADFGIDDLLRSLADRPGLVLKFSDMTLSRIDNAGLIAADWLERFTGLMGPDRLMWGSDVLAAGRSIADAAARAAKATESLPASDRRSVLRETAARLFSFPR